MCPSFIEIGSKTAEKIYAQTNRQTNRHSYENSGHLAVNQHDVSVDQHLGLCGFVNISLPIFAKHTSQIRFHCVKTRRLATALVITVTNSAIKD